jgi:hypothetical protein
LNTDSKTCHGFAFAAFGDMAAFAAATCASACAAWAFAFDVIKPATKIVPITDSEGRFIAEFSLWMRWTLSKESAERKEHYS